VFHHGRAWEPHTLGGPQETPGLPPDPLAPATCWPPAWWWWWWWWRWGQLTFLQLVAHHPEQGHGDHEEVEEEADLAELPRRRPAEGPDDPLVGGLGAEGGRVAQHRQPTHQEDQRALRGQDPTRSTTTTPHHHPELGVPAGPGTESAARLPYGPGHRGSANGGRTSPTRCFGLRFGVLGARRGPPTNFLPKSQPEAWPWAQRASRRRRCAPGCPPPRPG